MFSFGYPRGRGGSKKTKKRKAKKENWFEKLTVDQLKQLCIAVKVPVSGSKPAIVQRLLSNESSKEYAYEPRRISWQAYANYSYDSCDDGSGPGGDKPDGPCAVTIKSRVRDAGLSVTGNKFELVLRLLQHQNGVGNPKRGAVHVDEDGESQPKKRAKSMKLPDAEKLYDRVAQKASIDFQKASDMKLKYHAHGVMMLINKLAQQEVMDKQLVSRGETTLAWSVCESLVLPTLPEEGTSAEASPCYSWGRVEDSDLEEFGDLLATLAQETKQHSPSGPDTERCYYQHCDAAALAALAEQHTGWIQNFAAMLADADAEDETLDGFRRAAATLQASPLADGPVSLSAELKQQQQQQQRGAEAARSSPPTAVKLQHPHPPALHHTKPPPPIDFLAMAFQPPVPV